MEAVIEKWRNEDEEMKIQRDGRNSMKSTMMTE